MSEQLSPFHAALTAFEIRFESELTDRWQALESEAALAAVSAPLDKKRSVLHGFFEDAEREIGNVIHEYFPRLLQVATTQRQHLENESPLTWTQAQVLRQVCNFLGVDGKFDHTSPPREDSRLVVAAARIALNVGWLDEAIPADFVLPCWVESRWARAFVGRAFRPRAEDDAESLPTLSRAETLEWLKHREFWMSRRLERQIENDGWDGIIDAGKSNVSVLHAFVAAEQGPDGKESTQRLTAPHEHSFLREATTWEISFGDEVCRLKTMIGLDYIAVLLQNPLKAIRARELLSVAGGLPASSSAEYAATSLRDGGFAEKNEDQGDRYSDQSDFGDYKLLDDDARRNVDRRLADIDREMVYSQDMRDAQKVNALQQEALELKSYLRGSRDLFRRPRAFASENEKARTSITNALKRAYEGIGKQAPKTALHLKSNIGTGSEFMYLDASSSWKVRRTP
jgi:hypothetical protein